MGYTAFRFDNVEECIVFIKLFADQNKENVEVRPSDTSSAKVATGMEVDEVCALASEHILYAFITVANDSFRKDIPAILYEMFELIVRANRLDAKRLH